jgi:CheY-like chemotaxis protein
VNSLAIIREKAASRRVRLHIEASADLGSIHADPRKVKQIVYNLLSNAVKFAVEGGEVTLHARRAPRAQVGRLTGVWPGRSSPPAECELDEFLELTVTDTGIGIAQAGLVNLFKPFSQIDSGLARKYEGSGLGLAMVKVLAELHGGTVAAESELGTGSRFTVWLPWRGQGDDVSRVAPPPLPTPPVTSSPQRTALVVEDEPAAAELIRLQLEVQGFTVVHAASAEAALVLAVQHPLSLITLDILLPDMDGWDFLARLKELPALRRIPVVIISMTAERTHGFALGAAAIMQKPISRDELHAALGELGLLPRASGNAVA